jgi:sphingomyelin phosphodiesterase acid-like 3
MAVFGHTHQNEFRIVGEGDAAIPLKIVPSVSPIRENNPAFLVADVTPAFAWSDYQAWYLPLSEGKTTWEREFDFDTEYGQTGWNATTLQAVAAKLKSDDALRKRFFLEMGSGNPAVTIPLKWQDSYLCGLSHLTPESVIPCVAESQLDLPLP